MSTTFDQVMSSKKNGRRRIRERVCFSAELATEYDQLAQRFLLERQDEDERPPAGEPGASSGRRMAEKPASTKTLAKMAELIEQNPDAFYDVEFEQLRESDWKKLKSEHPPLDSEVDEEGRTRVKLADTFPKAAVEQSMTDPAPTPEVLDYFAETLSDGEWERLGQIIWNLNEGVRKLPKAEALSLLLGGSESD